MVEVDAIRQFRVKGLYAGAIRGSTEAAFDPFVDGERRGPAPPNGTGR